MVVVQDGKNTHNVNLENLLDVFLCCLLLKLVKNLGHIKHLDVRFVDLSNIFVILM